MLFDEFEKEVEKIFSMIAEEPQETTKTNEVPKEFETWVQVGSYQVNKTAMDEMVEQGNESSAMSKLLWQDLGKKITIDNLNLFKGAKNKEMGLR